jgi:isopentenyl diphosphate isomerase/L-lactate dehydrogenase-like FMN-dependent dehydrogenase
MIQNIYNSNVTLDLIKRAENAKYEAIVVTLDAQNFGKKRDMLRESFKIPSHLRQVPMQQNYSL